MAPDTPVTVLVDLVVAAAHAEDGQTLAALAGHCRDYSVLLGDWEDGGTWVDDSAVLAGIQRWVESREVSCEALFEARHAELLADPHDLSLSEFREFIDTGAGFVFDLAGGDEGWHVTSLTASDGRQAWLACWVFGSSWEGLDVAWLGVSATGLQHARQIVRRYAYVDIQDLASRYPTRLDPVSAGFPSHPIDAETPHARHRRRFAYQRTRGHWHQSAGSSDAPVPTPGVLPFSHKRRGADGTGTAATLLSNPETP